MQEEAREGHAEINEGEEGEVFQAVPSANGTRGTDGDLAPPEHPDSFVMSHTTEGLSEADIREHAEENEGEGYAQNHSIQRQEIFHQLRENLEQSEGDYAPHYTDEGEDHYSEQEAFDYQQQYEQEHYAEEAHDVVGSQGMEGNNDNASIEAEQKRMEEEEEEERSKKPIPPKSNFGN